MSKRSTFHRLARWHIWLGWLVGVPLLLWTLSGLVMVARPIEEVRGTSLRLEQRLATDATGPIDPFATVAGELFALGYGPVLVRNRYSH